MKIVIIFGLVCLSSFCLAFREIPRGRGGSISIPHTPPFNPGNFGLPDAYKGKRFRRADDFQAIEEPQEMIAPEEDASELSRLRRSPDGGKFVNRLPPPRPRF